MVVVVQTKDAVRQSLDLYTAARVIWKQIDEDELVA